MEPSGVRGALSALLPPLLLALALGLLLRGVRVAPALLASLLEGSRVTSAAGVEYESLRQAERSLGLEVVLPTHVPAELVWPPVVVRGVEGPPASISFLLLSADQKQALVITETRLTPSETWAPGGTPIALSSGMGYGEFGGGPGAAEGRLVWGTKDLMIEVRGSYSIAELVRIADSFPN